MTASQPLQTISRSKLLMLVETGLQSKSLRFTRQAALTWLAVFPGDMEIGLALVRVMLMEGKFAPALEMLDQILAHDPEYGDAHELVISALTPADETRLLEERSCLAALGRPGSPDDVLDWSLLLASARQALQAGELDEAERLIHPALGLNPDSPLAAIYHLRATYARQEAMTTYRLASLYHARWPDCLQFAMHLAEAQMELGDESGAVRLLHRCAAEDAAGQVAERIWGAENRYRALWPDRLEVHFDLAIPAEVAQLLGGNYLPSGLVVESEPVEPEAARPETDEETGDKTEIAVGSDTAVAASADGLINNDLVDNDLWENELEEVPAEETEEKPEAEPAGTLPTIPAEAGSDEAAETTPSEPIHSQPKIMKRPRREMSEAGRSAEAAFERLAKTLKKPAIGAQDGRFPVYLLLTTRGGLLKQYGEQTLTLLQGEMARLGDAVRKHTGWDALVYLPDDPASSGRFGLAAVDGKDPWKIKLALADLDQALSKKGQMIGAVLIVGGPDVVPFHKLPNPTDDSDEYVWSDNPYATLDSNYFAPEWPVGRLPGEKGQDVGLLLDQLRRVTQYHLVDRQPTSLWQRLLGILFNPRRKNTVQTKSVSARPLNRGFGYTAAAWKRSSTEVYRKVSDGKSMLQSPPEASGSIPALKLTGAALGYFNLHGVADGADWYGQKEVNDTKSPDYPVALSPQDVVKNGHAPQVVFSEACYGGFIIGKEEMTAMSLRFLGIGTPAVVAATAVSYGAVGTPLVGADLLGALFWNHLGQGEMVGEALMQAKLDLIREMNQRQGVLDGGDQKTLIEFVLYGDPLYSCDASRLLGKSAKRSKAHPTVKTVVDSAATGDAARQVSSQTMREVKRVVEPYLPGLEQAEIRIHSQKMEGNGNQITKGRDAAQRLVVTVSKTVRMDQHRHDAFARVTLDSHGKMVKLEISR